MDRDQKRKIIISTFSLAVIFFLTAVYFLLRTAPTCNDGVKNHGETDVDCGGPCSLCVEKANPSDLQVVSKEWIYDRDNKYDIAIKIKNPNDLFGAASFFYTISLVDSNGSILSKSERLRGYALPGKEKYLLIQGIVSQSEPADARVEIDSISWEKFSSYEEPNFIVNNKKYEVLSGGMVGFSNVSGTVVNQSRVDFEIVLVKVLLRDEKNTLIAVNSQMLNTIRQGEQRDFFMTFPHSFPGSVSTVEAEVDTNVFDSENYIRIHGIPGKWNER